jgi:hypothetical protein
VDAVVFSVAAGLVGLFVVWGVVFTDSLASATESTLTWLLERFGWLFVLSAAAFVAFAAYMGFSRYGTMRLGRDEDRPEFNTVNQRLTTDQMIAMNRAVDLDKTDVSTVTARFLRQNGLLRTD